MTDEQLYCDEPDCDREVAGHGRGKCFTHLKQLQRTGRTSPIAERVSLRERLINAYAAHAEAEGEEEYDRTWHRFIDLAKRITGDKSKVTRKSSAAIRHALARARAEGKRLGRPPKVTTERVLELVSLLRRPRLVAAVLGVHRDTVYAHLARASEKGRTFPTNAGPRLAG